MPPLLAEHTFNCDLRLWQTENKIESPKMMKILYRCDDLYGNALSMKLIFRRPYLRQVKAIRYLQM